MIALVDCNNFFASAERVLRPDLKELPVAVLSNNDGCIIARCAKVKALGIPMGAPLYQYQRLLQAHNVQVFSGNFALYSNMSARVMAVLREHCQRMQIYSIDEAFLDISTLAFAEQGAYCRELIATVQQWTGIPVSIGVAPSKTLAKLASYIAKQNPKAGGCWRLLGDEQQLLCRIAVDKVWGIGAASARKLKAQGINSVWQLRNLPISAARSLGGVNLVRSVHELNAHVCLPLATTSSARQQIRVSRTFGSALSTQAQLQAPLFTFAMQAIAKLRRQQSVAGLVSVFIASSRFAKEPVYRQMQIALKPASADYQQLINAVSSALAAIYTAGVAYKQGGVQLGAISSGAQQELQLATARGNAKLASAIDSIRQKHGSTALQSASSQRDQHWRARQAQLSAARLDNWQQLPRVGAC